jgi:hypothetical protein
MTDMVSLFVGFNCTRHKRIYNVSRRQETGEMIQTTTTTKNLQNMVTFYEFTRCGAPVASMIVSLPTLVESGTRQPSRIAPSHRGVPSAKKFKRRGMGLQLGTFPVILTYCSYVSRNPDTLLFTIPPFFSYGMFGCS